MMAAVPVAATLSTSIGRLRDVTTTQRERRRSGSKLKLLSVPECSSPGLFTTALSSSSRPAANTG
eukprot:6600043-Prymnesium_polylepis.1